MNGQRIIRTAAAGGQRADRISNLPDEVIHEILYRVRSPKQTAQLAILSRRWTHVSRSYPVFDFDVYEWPIKTRKQNLNKFLTATAKKLSDLQHAAVLRITMHSEYESDLVEKLSGFVAMVTQEVRLEYSHLGQFIIPQGLFNDDRHRSLKVVKLRNVSFPSGSSVRFGPSLQVLSLRFIRFPDKNDEGDRILNSIIAGAPYLETLKLSYCILGIRRVQIRDHPNLKILNASKFNRGNLEICGTESLEILHVYYGSEEKCQVSLSPNNNVKVLHIADTYHATMSPNNNVKVLHIADTYHATSEEINKFISKFSRLESLKLIDLPKVHEVLKINFNNHKLLRALSVRCLQAMLPWKPNAIEIVAPGVSRFDFELRGSVIPDILINKEATSRKPVVHCRLLGGIHWYDYKLKVFLARLSQFQSALEFIDYRELQDASSIHNNGDGSPPVPVIEHVKFSMNLLRLSDVDSFVTNLFRHCHPKILSFATEGDEVPNRSYALHLKKIFEHFMSCFGGRRCELKKCKSLHKQLKELKMMTRVTHGGIHVDRQLVTSSD